MTRQKIVFLIVLAAAALFIAAIVGSMFATKQTLPNGYEISVSDKGEIWVQSRDHKTLVTDVTAVWSAPDRMLVEQRTSDEAPPHRDRDCAYQMTDANGALRPATKAEAQAIIGGLKLQTGSSRACLK
ncbi:hypothetical protein [Caulobacter sp. 1776]|uniref:hypothetical protein n=1 Tax=Caulobacter sp. 1776 TaxID=3156420 RepID=UPI003397CF15